MSRPVLDAAGKKVLFEDAHTHYAWLDRPVPDETLRALWDLVKMGPTGANLSPMRLVFVKSPDAKAKLIPTLMPTNQEKARTAPVTVIVAYDVEFHRQASKLSTLVPGVEERIGGLPEAVRERMAYFSSGLQAGYLVMAARGLGLDVGPMGGFDPGALDKAFFPDGKWKSSLVVNLGYGDESKRYPRQPRLSFDEAARIE